MSTLPLDEAILRTLLYADIFDYPLTPDEIHHFLIEASAGRAAVLDRLAHSPWLQARVAHSAGYVTLRNRQGLGAVRTARAAASAALPKTKLEVR